MDRELFEAQWPQIKTMIREKWASLTDEDLRQINGRYDVLVSKLQQKYGYTREQVEEEVNRWSPTLGSKTYDAARATSQDSSSLIKWLIAAAIALALWWLWQASQENKMTDTTPTTTQTTNTPMMTTDTTINDAITRAFQANPTIAKDMRTIKFTTNNGVVTVTGTVPTAAEKDMVTNTVQGINGVNQVVNRLEVR